MAGERRQTYSLKYGVPGTQDLLMKIHGELLAEYPSVTYFGVKAYASKMNEVSMEEELTLMNTDKVKELLLDLNRKNKLEHKKVRIGITIGSYEHDVFGLPEED